MDRRCGHGRANRSPLQDQHYVQHTVENAGEQGNRNIVPDPFLRVEDIGNGHPEGGGEEIPDHQYTEAGNSICILCPENQRDHPGRQQNESRRNRPVARCTEQDQPSGLRPDPRQPAAIACKVRNYADHNGVGNELQGGGNSGGHLVGGNHRIVGNEKANEKDIQQHHALADAAVELGGDGQLEKTSLLRLGEDTATPSVFERSSGDPQAHQKDCAGNQVVAPDRAPNAKPEGQRQDDEIVHNGVDDINGGKFPDF